MIHLSYKLSMVYIQIKLNYFVLNKCDNIYLWERDKKSD